MRQYRWEAAHITIILGTITALTLVTHLIGTPQAHIRPSGITTPLGLQPRFPPGVPVARPDAVTSAPKTAPPPTSDPREVLVGPSGISNRYHLVSANRKPLTSTVDELTVRLHVESLASENLVSPFGSDMLDITTPGLEPINPSTSFHMSIPAGNSQSRDVVFHIPASLNLEEAALHIHYYYYQQQIPLHPPSR